MFQNFISQEYELLSSVYCQIFHTGTLSTKQYIPLHYPFYLIIIWNNIGQNSSRAIAENVFCRYASLCLPG